MRNNLVRRYRKFGRDTSGERNGNAKLTRSDVDMIRKLRDRYSASELAALYKVSKSTVVKILSGERWET